jgi:hypothetical protein
MQYTMRQFHRGCENTRETDIVKPQYIKDTYDDVKDVRTRMLQQTYQLIRAAGLFFFLWLDSPQGLRPPRFSRLHDHTY